MHRFTALLLAAIKYTKKDRNHRLLIIVDPTVIANYQRLYKCHHVKVILVKTFNTYENPRNLCFTLTAYVAQRGNLCT